MHDYRANDGSRISSSSSVLLKCAVLDLKVLCVSLFSCLFYVHLKAETQL